VIRHILGKKTKRKIIVFESDDWGSFRFKNVTIRNHYMPNPKPGQWMHYNDCFESYDDVQALEYVLKSTEDKNRRHACFTFLMNPANPNFKAIEESNFKDYYYEKIDETFKKRKDGDDLLKWYHLALKENLVELGFHGREHLQVSSWMKALAEGDPIALDGFKNRIWGQAKLYSKNKDLSYRSTFKIKNLSELKELKINIKEGVQIIKEVFNTDVTYFLAPDSPFDLRLNKTLAKNGVKFIGLPKLHNNPLENKWYQKKLFWLGKKTKDGLSVITRNVMFEPNSPQSNNWVDYAVDQIRVAFKFRNPAVISTHRANYVSGLNPENRTNGLKLLEQLLLKIKTKWPDAEFMTSSQLGNELL
jgi:hypothetical protein